MDLWIYQKTILANVIPYQKLDFKETFRINSKRFNIYFRTLIWATYMFCLTKSYIFLFGYLFCLAWMILRHQLFRSS